MPKDTIQNNFIYRLIFYHTNMNTNTIFNLALSVSYVVAQLLQSYCNSTVTKGIYNVSPIVMFCFISLCNTCYAFLMLFNENNKSLTQTLRTLFNVDVRTFLNIITFDALADAFNTLPRCIKGLTFSNHALIGKSDILVSLFYSVFVRRNVKWYDYFAALFTMIGISIYFRNVLLTQNIPAIVLSYGTLSILLSKFSLEQAVLVEGTVIRQRNLSESHVLFLTNLFAPLTFLISLVFVPEYIRDGAYVSICDTYQLFLGVIALTIYCMICTTTNIISSFVLWAIYLKQNYNTFDHNVIKYGLMLTASAMWIVYMTIKIKCHSQNFSNVTFSVFSAITFAYNITVSESELSYPLLATIGFIGIGAFVRGIMSKSDN